MHMSTLLTSISVHKQRLGIHTISQCCWHRHLMITWPWWDTKTPKTPDTPEASLAILSNHLGSFVPIYAVQLRHLSQSHWRPGDFLQVVSLLKMGATGLEDPFVEKDDSQKLPVGNVGNPERLDGSGKNNRNWRCKPDSDETWDQWVAESAWSISPTRHSLWPVNWISVIFVSLSLCLCSNMYIFYQPLVQAFSVEAGHVLSCWELVVVHGTLTWVTCQVCPLPWDWRNQGGARHSMTGNKFFDSIIWSISGWVIGCKQTRCSWATCQTERSADLIGQETKPTQCLIKSYTYCLSLDRNHLVPASFHFPGTQKIPPLNPWPHTSVAWPSRSLPLAAFPSCCMLAGGHRLAH